MQPIKCVDVCILAMVGLLMSVTFGKVIKVVDHIVKQETDTRRYRGLELSNGLKAIVVSDPETVSAAASLLVEVGFLSDPWEAQGMAHFCEHMLFLGTEKYPVEGEYDKFLTSHGGSSNAYTESDRTVYFFSIDPDYLEEGLDRLSQFFIAPSFNASSVEREVNAVNSEYSMIFNSDYYKILSVKKALAKPKHDFTKFSVGSKETLFDNLKVKGKNPRDVVAQFFEKWYSANIMKLAIVGKQSLDELTEWVDSKFSAIRNKNVIQTKWDYPIASSEMNQLVKIETCKDDTNLYYIYPMTNINSLYMEDIKRYISYVLDDKGEKSLADHLSKLGWVDGYDARSDEISAGYCVVEISLTLTSEGGKHIEEITQLVTQYMNLLSSARAPEITYREVNLVGRNKFENKEKEEAVHLVPELCEKMRRHNFSDVLIGDYKTEYNRNAIDTALVQLKPQNLMVLYASCKFDSVLDKKTKWFNASYSAEKFEPSLVAKLSKIGLNPDLKLPPPNPFVTGDISLKPRDPLMGDTPELLSHDAMMDVWYHQDQKFLKPKASIYISLSTPAANLDPFHNIVLSIWVKEIGRLLLPNLYAATKIGQWYSISSFQHGIYIRVVGYPDVLEIMLTKIVDSLINFHLDPQRFQTIKEEGLISLRNSQNQGPLGLAEEHFGELLSTQTWTFDRKLQDYLRMEFSDFQRIFPTLFHQLHMKVFGSGNVDRQGMIDMSKQIKTKFVTQMKAQPYSLRSVEKKRAVQLFKGENSIFIRDHETEKDSAIVMVMQANQASIQNSLLVCLLDQAARAPLFYDLRTKQQLGYAVGSSAIELHGMVAFKVYVLSSRLPQYVEGKIDNSLMQLRKKLIDMSDSEFQSIKKGLVARRMTVKQQSVQASQWFDEIQEENYNFQRINTEKSMLTNITKKQLIDFYDAYVSPLSTSRSRLHIWIGGTEARKAGFNSTEICRNSSMPTCILDEIQFKEEHPLYPKLKPFKTVEEFVAARSKVAAEAA